MSEEEDKSYWRGQNLLLLRACREKCGHALTRIARTWLSAVGKSNVRLRSVCEELLHAPSLACLRGHVKRSGAVDPSRVGIRIGTEQRSDAIIAAEHCRVVDGRAAVGTAHIGIGLETQKLREAVGVASLDARVHGRRSSLRCLLWGRFRLQQGCDASCVATIARKVQRAHACLEGLATGIGLGREQE